MKANMEKSKIANNIPAELENSLEKIIHFGGISRNSAEQLKQGLDSFGHLQQQYANDKKIRKVREQVTPAFFELYTAVLKRVAAEGYSDPLLKMFLCFGYLDERLLLPEQIHSLYQLAESIDFGSKDAVYTIDNWLVSIYKQDKEPSINEFGHDYNEVFREKKKRGELRETDKSKYDNDASSKLQHEIENLFKLGQRICHGASASYFPVLYSDILPKDLTNYLLTPQRIKEGLEKLLQVDYSVFHREIVYHRPEIGINKHIIMKPVWPDYILLPTVGSRGIMWQELTGRVRNSAARFVLPLFCNGNLDTMLLEVISHFRWELSRSTSSITRTSNVSDSLVGEYSDYIQFYKKNRNLTEEAKEKIRLQMEKHRNNTREVFADDYKTWIDFEARGLLRLNKVARQILFQHCPFSLSIRESLEKHPLYNAQISRMNNLRNREIKILTANYARLTKNGAPLDPDLEQNLLYYQG